MARVKVVMMQKDEDDLLEPWLLYYGYLFGFESLHVFDNGSTHAGVCETLDRFERAGVCVQRDRTARADFVAKNELALEVMRAAEAEGGFDAYLPCDCDEFLAVMTAHGLSCRRRDIHAELDGLAGRVEGMHIPLSFSNVTGHPGCFTKEFESKGFFLRDTVRWIDHGFHRADSRHTDEQHVTAFAFLHHRYKTLPKLLEHARHKLAPFVDTDDREALRRFDGMGHHLVRYFFMGQAEYDNRAHDRVVVQQREFMALMTALGCRNPEMVFAADDRDPDQTLRVSAPGRPGPDGLLPFDGRQYHATYPVVHWAGMPALQHYLDHGCLDGWALPGQALERAA